MKVVAPQHLEVRGVTLLELTLATGVLLVLAAAIFAITNSTVGMMSELNAYYDEETERSRFIELCRINFEEMGPEGELEFKVLPSGSHYFTYLSLTNTPQSFSFGGAPPQVSRIVLSAQIGASGLISVAVHYLNSKQEQEFLADEFEFLGGRKIVLLKDLRQFTWRFYDSRLGWVNFWPGDQGNPRLIELSFARSGDLDTTRSVFWLPGNQVPPNAGGAGPGENNEEGEE